MKYLSLIQEKVSSRSPHGERGLKYFTLMSSSRLLGSLPSRGAWIEIASFSRYTLCGRSLPSRGAWIEIPDARLQRPEYLGRSPHGERGLKF